MKVAREQDDCNFTTLPSSSSLSRWIEKRAFLSGSSAKMAVLTCSSVRSVHFVLRYFTEYYLIKTASNVIIWGLFAYYHHNKVHFVFSKSRSSQVNHMSSFPGHNGSWSKGTLWICGKREIAHCPQMAKIKFNKKNGTCMVIYVAYRVHRSMQPCHLEWSIYAKCSCILGGSCSFLWGLPQPWSRSIIPLFYFISTSDMWWAWDTFLLSIVGIGIAALGLSDGVQNGGKIRNINHYQYDNIIALWSLWSGSDQFADLLLCISNVFFFR